MSARLLAALLTVALLALACDRSEDETVEVTVDGSPVASPTSTATATATPRAPSTVVPTPSATPDPDTLDPDDLSGFTPPVPGACLPYADSLMPNAPRLYRNGVHEGVDIYPGYACAYVELNTPALAMYDGVVVRADLGYVEITPEQVTEFAARTARQGYTDPETLDIYRGRQVWIDHGSGVVARYAHLASIADGIEVGVEVTQGQVVGGLGESGSRRARPSRCSRRGRTSTSTTRCASATRSSATGSRLTSCEGSTSGCSATPRWPRRTGRRRRCSACTRSGRATRSQSIAEQFDVHRRPRARGLEQRRAHRLRRATNSRKGCWVRVPGIARRHHPRGGTGRDARRDRRSVRGERRLDRVVPGERPLEPQPAAGRRDDPRAGRPPRHPRDGADRRSPRELVHQGERWEPTSL